MSDSRVLAVHFGPGKLGLGLVVDLLRESDSYDINLIGRPGRVPPDRDTYQLRLVGKSPVIRERKVEWCGNPSTFGELPEASRLALGANGTVLITASLTAAAAPAAEPLIREILESRPAGSSTLFLVCENDKAPMYHGLLTAYPAVDVRFCVVDRICCWDPEISPQGLPRVLVHEVTQWVVPDGEHEALNGLASLPDVLVLPGSADAYAARKLWIVNGIHMVLATIARREGVDNLPLTGHRGEQFKTFAEPLAQTMLDAAEREFGLPVDEAFAADRVRAFCDMPDSASRILKDRYLRADLRPFIQRLDSRVSAAARVAVKHDIDIWPFLHAFEEVTRAIETAHSFLDVGVADPETGRLLRNVEHLSVDELIDRDVEDLWLAAMDWAPIGLAKRLQRRIRAALTTWRS